ncbi:MAG: hypothetical protein ACXQS2_03825 [Methermicoccaceae archaeon]
MGRTVSRLTYKDPLFPELFEEDELEVEEECFIVLKDKARDLIKWAKEKDMDVVLVSLNDPEPVLEAVKAFGLDFDRTYVNWYGSKIKVIAEDMKKHNVDKAVFIDDNVDLEVLKFRKPRSRDKAKTFKNQIRFDGKKIELFGDIDEFLKSTRSYSNQTSNDF